MNYDTVVGINKEQVDHVDVIVMMADMYRSVDIHPRAMRFNESTGRGWFAVNLSRDWSATERLVFDQEWDTIDGQWEDKYKDTRYDTYLRVTYKAEDKKVKCEFTNGIINWYSFKEFFDKWGTHDYSVEELKVKPYFYTNDIGKRGIAGQLSFMSVVVKEPYEGLTVSYYNRRPDVAHLSKDDNLKDKLSDILPDEIVLPEAKEPELPEIEERTPPDERKVKLYGVLGLIDMTPKEAFEILTRNAYFN